MVKLIIYRGTDRKQIQASLLGFWAGFKWIFNIARLIYILKETLYVRYHFLICLLFFLEISYKEGWGFRFFSELL